MARRAPRRRSVGTASCEARRCRCDRLTLPREGSRIPHTGSPLRRPPAGTRRRQMVQRSCQPSDGSRDRGFGCLRPCLQHARSAAAEPASIHGDDGTVISATRARSQPATDIERCEAGSQASIAVPLPGTDATTRRPPRRIARSRMPAKPRCIPPSPIPCRASKPMPSSAT
jgi:hypothetical protein